MFLLFNQTCLNERLLPNYIRTHISIIAGSLNVICKLLYTFVEVPVV